jgi:hypothetical protein
MGMMGVAWNRPAGRQEAALIVGRAPQDGFDAQSSTNTPCVDLGCRKATSFPAAPSKGLSWINRTPAPAT